MSQTDPYRHHPELRGRINPPEESFFRDFDLAVLDARLAESGRSPDWRLTCEEREARRKAWLADRMTEDLWVFGYGSLMWDPGMMFTEVRRAHCRGFVRSFCLQDDGGRGSTEHPGLMLAMDEGPGCTGLAFRIPAVDIDAETFILFRRELLAEAYKPVWVALETDQGPIEALSFAANRAAEDVVPDIPIDQQAAAICAAQGMLGSNFDYLENTFNHLHLMGVPDPYIDDLMARTKALRATV